MNATSRRLLPALILGIIAIALACGSDNEPSADPFPGVFRAGLYSRTDGGTTYELNFGDIGRYTLKADGADHRAGSYTFVGTKFGEINTAFAFIDERAPVECAEEDEPGVYRWSFKFEDNTLSLDVFDESCGDRKNELESEEWLKQPDPSPTPAPAASP